MLKDSNVLNKDIQTNKANTTLAILNQTASLSLSKPLFQAIIPSMLATASILSTPLEAAWGSSVNAVTCNSPCEVKQSKTADNKDAIIWASKPANDLTINSGVSLVNTKENGGSTNRWSRVIEINNSGTVGTITNKGTISGAGFGIRVKGKVNSIKIENGASVYGGVASIYNTGTISGGITIASGASVTGLIGNKGTIGDIDIKGKLDGREIFAIENIGKITGSINIGSGASVEGHIANFGTITEKIEVASGASVTGNIYNVGRVQEKIEIAGNVSGEITVYDNASVGEISISGGSVSGEIENQGTISGGISIAEGSSVGGGIENFGTITKKIEVASGASVTGDIYNEGKVQEEIKVAGNVSGNLQNSGTINKGITIAQSANLSGKIENKKGATITGGITNNSDNKLVVNSEGKIEKNANGYTITNNGNGGVEVEAFLVVGNSIGVPEKLIIGGSGDQSKNKTGKLTIDTSVDTKELVKGGFALVEGVNKENVGTFAHIDPEIQIEIERTIFSQNSNKVGRTVTKALSASADKRANFAETTMNNSLKGLSHSLKQQMRSTIGSNSLDRDAMYASAGLNDFTTSFDLPNPRTSAAFMLPYYTKHSSQMQEGWNDATGDTKGIVVGYTRLIGEDFLGVYAGSDKMKLDASNPKGNNAMALENNTYYGGIKYAGIFQKIEEHELYYRVDGKLAWTQNKITETIGGEQATGRPSTIGYGLGINVGANLSLSPTTTLVPEMGFAYEGGIMDAYTIKINRHTKTYESEPTHFYNTTLSLGWIENWNAFIQTQLEGGGRYNFNRKARTTLKVEGVGTTTAKLNARETFSPFIGSSVIFTFQPNLVLSLNYLGVFDNQTKNNTFYSQFAYLW